MCYLRMQNKPCTGFSWHVGFRIESLYNYIQNNLFSVAMSKPTLSPTVEQTYILQYDSDTDPDFRFGDLLRQSRRQEELGQVENACNIRYQAVQRLIELIPDDEETVLDWEDGDTCDAMMLVHASAIDHYLVGDWEMAAALLEMLLELDPEDHLEATVLLAWTYIAMEEYDSLDSVINDVNDKFVDKALLTLWSEYRRTGRIASGELFRLKKQFPAYFAEFTASEHPAGDDYLEEIAGEHPSAQALAREMWFRTEHLWKLFPGFIEALQKA